MQQLTITLNGGIIGLVSVFLAIIVSGLAIASHFRQRKTFFREEGKAVGQIDALKLKVAELTAWRIIVETKNHNNDIIIARIDENMKFVIQRLEEMKQDQRCKQDSGK